MCETYSLNLDENGLGEVSVNDILESSFDWAELIMFLFLKFHLIAQV